MWFFQVMTDNSTLKEDKREGLRLTLRRAQLCTSVV